MSVWTAAYAHRRAAGKPELIALAVPRRGCSEILNLCLNGVPIRWIRIPPTSASVRATAAFAVRRSPFAGEFSCIWLSRRGRFPLQLVFHSTPSLDYRLNTTTERHAPRFLEGIDPNLEIAHASLGFAHGLLESGQARLGKRTVLLTSTPLDHLTSRLAMDESTQQAVDEEVIKPGHRGGRASRGGVGGGSVRTRECGTR
ncbi:hypothetical protein B0H12DRAFT_1079341 [Mycena haematopus]|nr:hypothetical protein B0H12DRAFT_1079341 [Mycena haematopus]